MNIFILDENINKNAQYHVDSHVVKMPLETAQLLCSVHWQNGGEAPYKKTHVNHPCSKWARTSLGNYLWLCDFGKALCQEYSYRFGKIHKCEKIIDWCLQNKPDIEDVGLTKFILAMPDVCKVDDPVISYRNYYNSFKSHLFKWKNRNQPHWIEKSKGAE